MISVPAASDMDEIIRDFLVESTEELDLIESRLIELDQDCHSPEKLAEIFRAVHTLKGSSGMLGYAKLGSVAHAGESLLAALRDGHLALTPALITGLLVMVDALRTSLRSIKQTGSEGDGDYVNVVSSLEGFLQYPATPLPPAGAVHDAPADGLEHGEVTSAQATIRVNVGLLDRLMDLAGELVLARNQILGFAAAQNDGANIHSAQRLKRVTAELQATVMKTRLQPIGSIWNRFPRLARDLALACGKQVIVELDGSETELDRGILEAIKDPLTHILRNAIAHGIESPERRVGAGKSPAGRVRVCAFHQEGRVCVSVSDDGAGVNLEEVQERALHRGLITPEQAVKMGEQELAKLVFLPGFSTAETVTSICGRGIGLDIVRANIEKIGGVVDLQSLGGRGTTLHFEIPLTLAVVPALVVSSAGQQFAIPQANLVEVASLQEACSIEQVCGAQVLRLRDRLLPLCFLGSELHLESAGTSGLCVVVEAGGHQFGLVVNAVRNTEEIVVKPLGAQLSPIPCFAGAALLGDGQIVLILDVTGLARMAGIAASSPRRSQDDIKPRNTRNGIVQKWLIFRGSAESRFALPLSAVVRLDKVPADRIEHSAGREVIQYGGEILPLLRVSRLFNEPEREHPFLSVRLFVIPKSASGW